MSAHKWIVANSVAVVLAVVSGAHAQTSATAPMEPTTNTPAITTAPTPTGVQASDSAMSTTTTQSTWTASSPANYSILLNKPYDYTDLMAAKAQGWDDSHIAMFANIAEKAGVPFNQIVEDANRGWSFAAMGQKYGLTDSQIYDAQNNITEIKEYKTAYLGVPPPDSNLYAQAVSRRDNDLMARALAPSPLPTLSPIATSSSSEVAQTTTTTVTPAPAPTQTAEATPAPAPAPQPVLAHRTMTKTVRIAAPIHHRRYARITRHHRYSSWRRLSHRMHRYHSHRAPAAEVYHRGS
ncbi:hypothetical protein CCAX7_16520 [Capsulimonas corticalis]|uniref:Uncharacterized protein n=1 Tax=Capsulimonas corticalis TaxID=2219043 RepID=A0A402CYY2_9BACT|nr:hypothetical protein [Capsulimonas corticalis]BDI29601.1 hypothetical protein CCAX7_16520 [Capsulimonas corticalis]